MKHQRDSRTNPRVFKSPQLHQSHCPITLRQDTNAPPHLCAQKNDSKKKGKKEPLQCRCQRPLVSRCKVQENNVERGNRRLQEKSESNYVYQGQNNNVIRLCVAENVYSLRNTAADTMGRSIVARWSCTHRFKQNNNRDNCNGLGTLTMPITITINYTLSSVRILTALFPLTELIRPGRGTRVYVFFVGVYKPRCLNESSLIHPLLKQERDK